MDRANNATLALQGSYDDHTPDFMALFAREGRAWPRFYDRLGGLPKAERDAELKRLQPPQSSGWVSPHGARILRQVDWA